MKLVKLLLLSTCISSLIAAILLLWNESEVTCGVTTCKVMETMFIIVAVATSKEAASIKTRVSNNNPYNTIIATLVPL